MTQPQLTEEEKLELYWKIQDELERAITTGTALLPIIFKGVTYTYDEAVAALGDNLAEFNTAVQDNITVHVATLETDYAELGGALTTSFESYLEYQRSQQDSFSAAIYSRIDEIISILADETTSLGTKIGNALGVIVEVEAERLATFMGPIISGLADFGAAFAGRLMDGLLGSLESIELEGIPAIKPMLDELKALPDLPETQRKLIDDVTKEGGGPWQAVVVMMLGAFFLWTALGAAFQPISKLLTYQVEKGVHSARLPEPAIRELVLRGIIDSDRARNIYAELGWSGQDVEALERLYEIIPPLADMVRFADFSAFDPEVISKWRAFYDAPEWIKEPFKLIGVFGDWADKYWFSHWRQPGRFELEDMFWRRIIDEDTARLAYRTMGYSEFWQDAFIKKIYTPFTRVDVRRMWDIGVLDDDETVLAYQDIGYSPDNARKFLVFTKLFQRLPDLRSRFSKGWITSDELLTELINIGLQPDRAMWELETLIKADKPERVAKERDLTKAEIYKGVKKELITWDEGVDLLEDLGYDNYEANFIIAINVAVAEGSPESYLQFKKLTQDYRKAEGLYAKEIPAQVIEAERELKAAEDTLQEAKSREAEQSEIYTLEARLAQAQYSLEALKREHDL